MDVDQAVDATMEYFTGVTKEMDNRTYVEAVEELAARTMDLYEACEEDQRRVW